jgi:hypothetical protein
MQSRYYTSIGAKSEITRRRQISNEMTACGKFFRWLGNARGDRRFSLSFSRNYYITDGTGYPSDSGNPNIWWCAPDTRENRGRLDRAIRRIHWLAKATQEQRALFASISPPDTAEVPHGSRAALLAISLEIPRPLSHKVLSQPESDGYPVPSVTLQ